MTKLVLEVDAVEIGAQLHQLIDALTSLQKIPEFPFDQFQSLVFGLLPEVAVSFDPAASSAGNLRAVCGVSGNLELVTTALVALQHYLHDFLPCDAFGVEAKR